MTTWTNELVLVRGDEVHVKFTSSSGQVFTKIYKETYSESLLQEKLDFINLKQTVFEGIKSQINLSDTIRDGWTFKFTYAHMPSDFIEIFTEIYSPWQTFYKMFNVTTINDIQGLGDYIANEKVKINTMIDLEDLEGLENYFGEEVTLDGSNIE